MPYHVYVVKNHLSYICQQQTEQGFKCGKCGRGNIKPKQRFLCKVCNAKVTKVVRIEQWIPYHNRFI